MADNVHAIHGASQSLFPEIAGRADRRRPNSMIILLFFLIILIVGTFICWINESITTNVFILNTDGGSRTKSSTKYSHKKIVLPLINCANAVPTMTCPMTNYPATFEPEDLSGTECPEYFRWIYEDLRPWKDTGISRETLERAKEYAHFRLVIVDGRAYVERLRNDVFQTRDIFTIWGFLQLLRLYPGLIPDLELMFFCDDRPVIEKSDYQGANATLVPPMFHYCANDSTMDIIFPDWTFWGWAETNIKPWKNILEEIKEGNKRTKWKDRVPYGYWKGNPDVCPTRGDMMKCNLSDKYDWNARLYKQNWEAESRKGYKLSSLKDQCTHRYKIYIEGWGWSVSDKYIMACDSMTLLVKPHFHDFFIRSMVPMQHYWPIRTRKKCRDFKFAVEWGNNHTKEAQAIGEAGSKFIQENLKMEFVYDYMFHVLREYAKLLKFKPKITPRTVEVCPETVACPAYGLVKKFMVESMVKSPSTTLPCSMPPPYEPAALQSFLDEKERRMRMVETWEARFWQSLNKNQ